MSHTKPMCAEMQKKESLVLQDTDKDLILTREWCFVTTNTFLTVCVLKRKNLKKEKKMKKNFK